MLCPVCNDAEIEYIDTYDVEEGDDKLIESCVGYCPNCNASFEWDEVYKFIGQENLRLIKED